MQTIRAIKHVDDVIFTGHASAAEKCVAAGFTWEASAEKLTQICKEVLEVS